MSRFFKALIDFDFWLVRRAAMPVSHWIDYRFHVNQYDQGAAVLSCGLAMNVAANFSTFLRSPSFGWIAIVSSAGLVFVYSNWLKKMNIASRKYEQRPDLVSREAAFFLLWMSPFRLGVLFIGVQMAAIPWLPPTSSLVALVTCPWMILIAVSVYLAGCIPPSRPRREKKEWARPLVGVVAPT